jgi:hypothetical protein
MLMLPNGLDAIKEMLVSIGQSALSWLEGHSA